MVFFWECVQMSLSVVLLLALYYDHTQTYKGFFYFRVLGFVRFENLRWLLLNHSIFLQSAVRSVSATRRYSQCLSPLIEVVGKFKPCIVIPRYDLDMKQGMRHRPSNPFNQAGSS